MDETFHSWRILCPLMYITQCARYNSLVISMLSSAPVFIGYVKGDKNVARDRKGPRNVELLVFTEVLTGAP